MNISGSLSNDLRSSWRALTRRSAVPLAAILSLGLGIAANIAVFTLLRSEVLRPLPYHRPDRLVAITESSAKLPEGLVLTPEFASWRSEDHALNGIAAWNDAEFNLSGVRQPERINAATVNAGFLRVLGLKPSLGRDFVAEEDQSGGAQVTLVASELCRRQFGDDEHCIGQLLQLNDKPYTIIGVLPQPFRFPADFKPELLIPGGYSTPPNWSANTLGMLQAFGRLKDDSSVQQVATELDLIQSRHEGDLPALPLPLNTRKTQVTALSTQLSSGVRKQLFMFMGAVLLVLMITCVNVASLQLARTLARKSELSIRTALGASKSRLAVLMLGESCMIAAAGAALGLGGAWLLLRLFPKIANPIMNTSEPVTMDSTILAFAIALAAIAGIICGIFPLVAANRFDARGVLTSGSRSLNSGWAGISRSVLVISELAITLVLTVGTGLLLRSLANVWSNNIGLQYTNVLTFKVKLPDSRYDDNKAASFASRVLEQITSLPGVKSAAVSNALPFSGYSLGALLYFDDDSAPRGQTVPVISVTRDYFTTMGISLVAGLGMGREARTETKVAVVNSTFAHRFFPMGNALGKRVRWGSETAGNWTTIVGIVADVRHQGPEQPPQPELFVPFEQSPSHSLALAVKTESDPELLTNPVQAAVHNIDKDLPVFDVLTLEQRLLALNSSRRFGILLLGAFAGFAIILAALGVYGLFSYNVDQRKREIGVRMALGARRRQVLTLLISQSMKLTAVGVIAGMLLSLALQRYIRSFLYGVSVTDPLTYISAALFLFLVSFFATYGPARRAAHTDPNVVLRYE